MNHPMQPDLFPLQAARNSLRGTSPTTQARKTNGQFRAAGRAGSFWLALAMDKFETFLKAVRAEQRGARSVDQGFEFTFEGFRVWAESNGLPPPASLNAWGALPSAAKRAGLCESTGRADTAKRAESHGRLVRVWRAR